ncbi:MAG: hypothetical protein NZM10_00035, partial [Fimbriimonadales bacterium]|nr:hypothetical protein [Fimbriimonadales bacterium]
MTEDVIPSEAKNLACSKLIGSKLGYNSFQLEIVPIWGDGIPAIACDGTNAVAPLRWQTSGLILETLTNRHSR